MVVETFMKLCVIAALTKKLTDINQYLTDPNNLLFSILVSIGYDRYVSVNIG